MEKCQCRPTIYLEKIILLLTAGDSDGHGCLRESLRHSVLQIVVVVTFPPGGEHHEHVINTNTYRDIQIIKYTDPIKMVW